MKPLILLTLLLPLSAIADFTPKTGLIQAPDIICKDHTNQEQCRAAVKAVMFGTYSFTALDEQCESSSDAAKSKMDSTLKAQCAAAKEAVSYLRTLR